MSIEVTLYTRPGCHLCEDAKEIILPLLAEFGAILREVNIDEDHELMQRFGHDIPVIFIGEHKAAKHRVDREQFRHQLEEALSGGAGVMLRKALERLKRV
jgi:glutaredoxin